MIECWRDPAVAFWEFGNGEEALVPGQGLGDEVGCSHDGMAADVDLDC